MRLSHPRSSHAAVRFRAASGITDLDQFDVVVIPVTADGVIPLTVPLPEPDREELSAIADRFPRPKAGSTFWVPARAPHRPDVLLVTVGQGPLATPESLQRAAATAGRSTRGRRSVLCLLSPAGAPSPGEVIAEHWLLGAYEHAAYLSSPPEREICAVALWGCAEADIERGRLLAEVTNYARDLTNASAEDLTPSDLVSECERVGAELDLGLQVLGERELAEGGFGGILAVGRGSDTPPRLIEVAYEPVDGPFIALIGKGITYDAGGLSIKDNDGMAPMKSDMAGAASVLAAVVAVARMGLPINVRAYLACAENAVGPRSTRPGDVCTMRDGTTVELNNMDAEGRLVLADALVYAQERGASQIVDIATLTWGSGLGPEIFAVLGTDPSVVGGVLDAAAAGGEPAWQMPLYDGYESSLESSVADMKNFGPHSEKPFITLTGGLFLRRFARETPWAHVDIATTVMRDRATDQSAAGATGVGVRALVRYVLASSAGTITAA
ncbi:leucyl aminopeptidase family protein [Microbacterium sp. RD1]|uniref:leucyl aminopeptidase family protein n=1 Tax=Microbacterium sp. RD1 TaxID=3457313 RepID=UPI003FA59909